MAGVTAHAVVKVPFFNGSSGTTWLTFARKLEAWAIASGIGYAYPPSDQLTFDVLQDIESRPPRYVHQRAGEEAEEELEQLEVPKEHQKARQRLYGVLMAHLEEGAADVLDDVGCKDGFYAVQLLHKYYSVNQHSTRLLDREYASYIVNPHQDPRKVLIAFRSYRKRFGQLGVKNDVQLVNDLVDIMHTFQPYEITAELLQTGHVTFMDAIKAFELKNEQLRSQNKGFTTSAGSANNAQDGSVRLRNSRKPSTPKRELKPPSAHEGGSVAGKRTRCTHCQAVTHKSENCFKKAIGENAKAIAAIASQLKEIRTLLVKKGSAKLARGQDDEIEDNREPGTAMLSAAADGQRLFLDSGADRVYLNQRRFFTLSEDECRSCDLGINGPTGELVAKAEMVGPATVWVKNASGQVAKFNFREAYFAPELNNLVSVAVVLPCGLQVGREGTFFGLADGRRFLVDDENHLWFLQVIDPGQDEIPEFDFEAPPTHPAERSGWACAVTMQQVHQLVGHANKRTCLKILDDLGMPRPADTSLECVVCAQAKITRPPISVKTEESKMSKRIPDPQRFGHVVSADSFGPLPMTLLNQYRYAHLFLDWHTKFLVVKFSHGKGKEICRAVKEFVQEHLQMHPDYTVQNETYLLTDGEGSFTSQKLNEFLVEARVKHVFSPPHEPRLNGAIERHIRKVKEGLVALLLQVGLRKEHWQFAAAHIVLLHNFQPTSASGKSPFEKVYGRLPPWHRIRPFGDLCFVKQYSQVKPLDSKAQLCVHLGYDADKDSHILLNISSKRLVHALTCFAVPSEALELGGSTAEVDGGDAVSLPIDVKRTGVVQWSEGATAPGPSLDLQWKEALTAGEVDCLQWFRNFDFQSIQYVYVSDPPLPLHKHFCTQRGELPLGDPECWVQQQQAPQWVERAEEGSTLPVEGDLALEGQEDAHAEDNVVSSVYGSGFETWWNDPDKEFDAPADSCVAMQTKTTVSFRPPLDPAPKTVKQAFSNRDKVFWRQAYQEELTALTRLGAFQPVLFSEIPENTPISRPHVIFALKYSDDTPVRYKVRIVIDGSKLHDGVTTYAATPDFDVDRVVLALATHYGWAVQTNDVTKAFLWAPLDENDDPVYSYAPPFMPRTSPDGERLVYKLGANLYGTRVAPRNWQRCLFDFFQGELCGSQSRVDQCLWFVPREQGHEALVLTHVDDSMVVAEEDETATSINTTFTTKFETRVDDEASVILNMNLDFDHDAGTLQIANRALEAAMRADELVHRGAYIPCDPGPPPSAQEHGDVPLSPEQHAEYRRQVGKVLYLSLKTRPDLCQSVARLTPFTAAPRTSHWRRLLQLLRYLRSHPDVPIQYRRGKAPLQMSGFSDADFAADKDSRRSLSGYLIYLADAPVAWKAKYQTVVSLSTFEAELLAAVEATKAILYILRLLDEMREHGFVAKVDVQEPIPLYCDNLSLVKAVETGVVSQRTRHLDIRFAWLKEQILGRRIALKFIEGARNPADLMTKGLPRQRFEALLDIMHGPESERRPWPNN